MQQCEVETDNHFFLSILNCGMYLRHMSQYDKNVSFFLHRIVCKINEFRLIDDMNMLRKYLAYVFPSIINYKDSLYVDKNKNKYLLRQHIMKNMQIDMKKTAH